MRGEVVYFYAFDVANEILVERVAAVLGKKPMPFPLPVGPGVPKGIPFHQPLSVEPALQVSVAGRPARVRAHIYSVGVVSIALSVPFTCDRPADLLPFHRPMLDAGEPADVFARALSADVCADLAGALVRPSPPPEPEAYTAFCLSDLNGEREASRWLAGHGREVAGLLTGAEPERLSDGQVADVLRQQRSLEKTDLVVVDWDAALVLDLERSPQDVLYVLELANLQLEEFRVMDQTLDRYLNVAYEDLERRPVTLFGVASSVLRKLRRFRVDLTKLTDEVTHITKFFGDWHLARVYLLARERFHLDEWRASVEGRLGQLDRLYGVVHTELYEKRMFWLEVIIVVFFAIDLFALLVLRR
jgi:hypothetical protein